MADVKDNEFADGSKSVDDEEHRASTENIETWIRYSEAYVREGGRGEDEFETMIDES